MYKFTGFTEKANTALNIAVETAEGLGHTYIGSEHLLIGLLRDTGGVACVALAGRGVTAAAVVGKANAVVTEQADEDQDDDPRIATTKTVHLSFLLSLLTLPYYVSKKNV